jgi:hypothetical protein
MRLFEVWDEDNGALRIRAIPIDYADDDDPFAKEARLRAAVDFTAGWTDGDLNETGALELWFPKP